MRHFLLVYHLGIAFLGRVEGQNRTIGPYQVLQLYARVDKGVMAIKGYFTFPKLQHHWSLSIRLFRVIYPGHSLGKSYLCRGAVSVFYNLIRLGYCPCSWGCRMHWLHLCNGVRPSQMNILNITLNHLIVRLQSRSFGECEIPIHCH